MSHYLTIAYLDGEAQIILDQKSKRSEHNKLFKSLNHETAEGCEKVEIWSQSRGRIRVKNLKALASEPVQENEPKISRPSSPDSDSNNSQSPAPEGSDITKGAGDSAENVDTQPSDTHTKTDQSTAPAAIGAVAGQSEVSSDEPAPVIGKDASPADAKELPVEEEEVETSDGSDGSAEAAGETPEQSEQPELVKTPVQKGRKAAKKDSNKTPKK